MGMPTKNSLVHGGPGGGASGPLQQVPAWVAQMRQAAQDVITPDDVKAIVQNQVDKAKSGDQAAIKFVFDQILGGPLKGATFVQNVYHNKADGEGQEGPAGEEDDLPPPRVPATYQRPKNPFK